MALACTPLAMSIKGNKVTEKVGHSKVIESSDVTKHLLATSNLHVTGL